MTRRSLHSHDQNISWSWKAETCSLLGASWCGALLSEKKNLHCCGSGQVHCLVTWCSRVDLAISLSGAMGLLLHNRGFADMQAILYLLVW